MSASDEIRKQFQEVMSESWLEGSFLEAQRNLD